MDAKLAIVFTDFFLLSFDHLNKIIQKLRPVNVSHIKTELLSVLLGHLLLQADQVLVGPRPLVGGEVFQSLCRLVDLVADLDHDWLGPHQSRARVQQVGWASVEKKLEIQDVHIWVSFTRMGIWPSERHFLLA